MKSSGFFAVDNDPVEKLRKTMPRGDGNWDGYDHVYDNLQKAAHSLSQGAYTCCGSDHVQTMATMGTGHEETMKYWQMVCKQYGWC